MKETGADPASPEFQKAFRAAYDASLQELPWDIVMDTLEQTKGQMQVLSRNLIVGMVEGSLDPAVEKMGSLGSDQATQLVSMGQALTLVIPVKDQVAEALTAGLAANKKEKENIWPAREVTLTGKEEGKPVILAIWDSGVDVSLFPDQLFTVDGMHGIAYDLDMLPTTGYLMSLGDAEPRREELENQIEGFFDLQANIDSPEASALRQKMSTLDTDQVKPFVEGLSLYANYSHGTHVAGIAAAGNPYARILVSRLTFDYHMIPKPPTMELARNFAQAVQDAVQYYKDNGARVVNMSWGYNLKGLEDDLEKNGIGADAEERAEMAREMFQVMKEGMVKAISSAPEILFVAAAGNSDSDATFDEFVPSSLGFSNLLVAGAVDQAGEPTDFTSFGPTVKIYSNGFEVESYVPGGRRMKFSGTSMSSPNVVNLAGKLIALEPSLTPEQTIKIILDGADEMVEEDTVFLLNPKQSMEVLQREKGVKSDD
jgi:subtilisin family serine protease